MAEETKGTEAKEEIIPTTPTVALAETDDAEARIAAIEIEKGNYRVAYLKEKSKNKQPEDFGQETEDEKIERIVAEKLAASKFAQLDAEKDALYKKALKENKELKLAQLNKNNIPPASMGTHSESVPVTDTRVTPEQMAVFKSKGWTDKDIERYKKNMARFK